MGHIILDGAYIGQNLGDGVVLGPGATASMVGATVAENGRAGVRVDPNAAVDMRNASVIGNRDAGVVVEMFGDLIRRYPDLGKVEEDVLRDAVEVVGRAGPGQAEKALLGTRLYAQIKTITPAEWTQIAIGLCQLFSGLAAV